MLLARGAAAAHCGALVSRRAACPPHPGWEKQKQALRMTPSFVAGQVIFSPRKSAVKVIGHRCSPALVH